MKISVEASDICAFEACPLAQLCPRISFVIANLSSIFEMCVVTPGELCCGRVADLMLVISAQPRLPKRQGYPLSTTDRCESTIRMERRRHNDWVQSNDDGFTWPGNRSHRNADASVHFVETRGRMLNLPINRSSLFFQYARGTEAQLQKCMALAVVHN
jgi:hypothetical protein